MKIFLCFSQQQIGKEDTNHQFIVTKDASVDDKKKFLRNFFT